MAKATATGTAAAAADLSKVHGTASGSASADLSTLVKKPVQKPADPDLPAPGQPYSRTKPVQKESDVMGAFREAGKGLQAVKNLTNSRSPSKGGR